MLSQLRPPAMPEPLLSENSLPSNHDEKIVSERPSLSIRTRITFGFLICFLMALGITLASLFFIFRLEEKLHFLEVADNFTFEIQQARRFEKNYFLYGTNLAEAQSHVQTALTFLQSNTLKLQGVVGREVFQNIVVHTETYKALLENIQMLVETKSEAIASQRRKLESDLRLHGAEMISLAFTALQKERQSVEQILGWARRVPLFFLGFLFVLMIYLAHLLSRQILGPLTQLLGYTGRIAQGDFTPVIPTRPYRDEFSDLNLAMKIVCWRNWPVGMTS